MLVEVEKKMMSAASTKIAELEQAVEHARRGVQRLENRLRRRQPGSAGYAQTAAQLDGRRARLDAETLRLAAVMAAAAK